MTDPLATLTALAASLPGAQVASHRAAARLSVRVGERQAWVYLDAEGCGSSGHEGAAVGLPWQGHAPTESGAREAVERVGAWLAVGAAREVA